MLYHTMDPLPPLPPPPFIDHRPNAATIRKDNPTNSTWLIDHWEQPWDRARDLTKALIDDVVSRLGPDWMDHVTEKVNSGMHLFDDPVVPLPPPETDPIGARLGFPIAYKPQRPSKKAARRVGRTVEEIEGFEARLTRGIVLILQSISLWRDIKKFERVARKTFLPANSPFRNLSIEEDDEETWDRVLKGFHYRLRLGPRDDIRLSLRLIPFSESADHDRRIRQGLLMLRWLERIRKNMKIFARTVRLTLRYRNSFTFNYDHPDEVPDSVECLTKCMELYGKSLCAGERREDMTGLLRLDILKPGDPTSFFYYPREYETRWAQMRVHRLRPMARQGSIQDARHEIAASIVLCGRHVLDEEAWNDAYEGQRSPWRTEDTRAINCVAAAVTIKTYDELRDDETVYGQDCIIGGSPLEGDKPIAVLNCGHCFHEDCVKTWLSEEGKCPLCRKPVVEPADEDVPMK